MSLVQFGLVEGKEIQLVEKDVCYEVVNGDDFPDITPKIFSYGKTTLDCNTCEHRGVTKEEFEKDVMKCFKTDKLRWVEDADNNDK
jgi:hypothetical protein